MAVSANRLELLQIADAVAREKVIDRQIVIAAMEDAIAKAARSRYGTETDVHARIDPRTGELNISRHLLIVDQIENPATEILVDDARRKNPAAQVGDTIADTLPPFDFGRIAATNAISDVYAMGGTPIMALAIVGMPVNQLPHEMIGEILRGGQTVCADAGIPIAGGHTIDSVEPIYGLVVMGIAHPDRIRRNADARAGDQLILSKPLGVGILSAALKKQMLDDAGYFFPPDRVPATQRTLRSVLTKPGWNANEVRTLRGVLSALEGAHRARKT